MRIMLAIFAAFWAALPAHAVDPAAPRVVAAASLRKIESGAILAEDFNGPRLSTSRWRVWQEDPQKTSVRQEDGRLSLEGRGRVGHNGLWGLATAKYKDVVLVGEMDIRSNGPGPHRLALHLCGGDGLRSPDHWVELDMTDLGEKARFSSMAALPAGLERHQDKHLDLPHPAGSSFLCRVTLRGETNRAELHVRSIEGWKAVCPPIDLPLRTIHAEVKLHGNQWTPGDAEAARSVAWFDNVRIYPRPENHHVGVRLVAPGGKSIWFRQNNGWPPKIVDPSGRVRSIEDVEVQLRTAGGGRVIAVVRSSNMGFYLLHLKDAPWDVYPAAAEIRVLLDGKPLGPPLPISSRGVEGLYPDDVYEVVLAGAADAPLPSASDASQRTPGKSGQPQGAAR